ncbi:hypothetical protein B0J14DRAFT_702839 [Halenospora varia]|nr:hypothetical protein B0J14DRAFT_702839 [Halenospora varia]
MNCPFEAELSNIAPASNGLFALESAIYEIMAWEMPFEDLETDDVEKKYAAEKFPDVTRLLAGDIIRDCWAEKFDTSRDVEEAPAKIPNFLPFIDRYFHILDYPMETTLFIEACIGLSSTGLFSDLFWGFEAPGSLQTKAYTGRGCHIGMSAQRRRHISGGFRWLRHTF